MEFTAIISTMNHSTYITATTIDRNLRPHPRRPHPRRPDGHPPKTKRSQSFLPPPTGIPTVGVFNSSHSFKI